MLQNEFEKLSNVLLSIGWEINFVPDDSTEKEYFIEIRCKDICFRSPVYPNFKKLNDEDVEILTFHETEISITLVELNAIYQIMMDSDSLIKQYLEIKRKANPYIKAITYLEDKMKLSENDTLQYAIDVLESAVPNKK